MTTPGAFRTEVDPQYRIWISPENVRYVQREVARRLRATYREYIEVPYDRVHSMLIHELDYWRAPLTLNELLEKTICTFVSDIDTDIQWESRFNDYEPRRLYKLGSGITREEKVKLNPGYKFEFQMRY